MKIRKIRIATSKYVDKYINRIYINAFEALEFTFLHDTHPDRAASLTLQNTDVPFAAK